MLLIEQYGGVVGVVAEAVGCAGAGVRVGVGVRVRVGVGVVLGTAQEKGA